MRTKSLFTKIFSIMALLAAFSPVSSWAQEPYAVLSDNNTVLTFYYDNNKTSRGGMDVGPYTNQNLSYDETTYEFYTLIWGVDSRIIERVVFDASFANCFSITSTSIWFAGCKKLISIEGLNYLNTSNVVDMSFMFDNCSSLTSLDVSNFNTSNVTNMYGLFQGCAGLTSLNVSNFDTSNVTDMSAMFWVCQNLTNLDVRNFDTSNVVDMRSMFGYCSNLTSIDLSNFNTSKVRSFGDDLSRAGMFRGCSSLTSLDLKNFNTSQAGSMSRMFEDCTSLVSVDLSSFDTSNVQEMARMFHNCHSLAKLNVRNFDTSSLGTDSFTQDWAIDEMFCGCSSLTSLDLSNFDTSNITDMSRMFDGCSKLAYLDVSNFDTSNVTNMYEMFAGCSSLEALNVSNFNTSKVVDFSAMFADCSKITQLNVSNFDTSKAIQMNWMFAGCSSLSVLDVSNFNTEKVEMMDAMFMNCSSLTSLDLRNFNTSSVKSIFETDTNTYIGQTGMNAMFSGCSSLVNLDISSFDTSNVMNMESMFSNCSSLVSLDLGNFDTSNVTDMRYMFNYCYALSDLNISSFNTSKVTNMEWMFNRCYNLQNIDVSNFNTSNVTNMETMFSECTSLSSLDISSFNTSNVTNMYCMFSETNLETIYVGNGWSTSNVTKGDSIFYACPKLKGGNGTVYDSSHIDVSYAHIDGGPSNPGYFTDKNNNTPTTDDEPYAVLSDNNTVLTFYYDKNKTIRNGVDIRTFEHKDSLKWGISPRIIEKVIFDSSFAEYTSLTSTAFWFDGCENLVEISGFEYLKTPNVNDMQCMFWGCYNLISLDLRSFDTSKVTNMYLMFGACASLTSLDLRSFDTSKVTNMVYMFSGCTNISSINVSSFNTSNVTDMSGMFAQCLNLPELEISNFNTEKAKNMTTMFYGCRSITSLDISNFNTSNVTSMQGMFWDCPSLVTIYVGGSWSTSSVTDGTYMFVDSPMIIGGSGTVFDANHIDVSYAHVDGGPSNPGYFTYKNSSATGEASFDGRTIRVSGGASIDDAVANVGGLSVAAKTVAAIIWSNDTPLTADMISGITNPNLLIYVKKSSYAPAGFNNIIVDGVAQTISLVDATSGNGDFFCPQSFTAMSISYGRQFNQVTKIDESRGWETISLPFTVQTVSHESHGVIAPFGNNTSDKPFWLRQLSGSGLARATQIEANMPYLISMPNSSEYDAVYNQNGLVTFSSSNITVPVSSPQSTTYGSVTLVPTFQKVAQDYSNYVLNVGEASGQNPEGSIFINNYRDVRPFQAYVLHSGYSEGSTTRSFISIKSLINGEDGTTGIDGKEKTEGKSDAWFTIDGRKLDSKPKAKGIYISNGKKLIVR